MYTSGAIYSGAILRQNNNMDTACNLASAAGVYAALYVCKEAKVKRIMLFVTTAVVAGTTAPVVSVYYRPTPGSATGQILLGTLTIPNGTAANTVVFKDIEPVSNLLPGGEISFQRTTQAADPGTAAGAGFFGYDLDEIPEYYKNQPAMLLSV